MPQLHLGCDVAKGSLTSAEMLTQAFSVSLPLPSSEKQPELVLLGNYNAYI